MIWLIPILHGLGHLTSPIGKALVAFRFLEFLAWGSVLYIDDLITDCGARRNGNRGKLLKWVIEQGKQAKFDQIHLDSGFQGEKRILKQRGLLSESVTLPMMSIPHICLKNRR